MNLSEVKSITKWYHNYDSNARNEWARDQPHRFMYQGYDEHVKIFYTKMSPTSSASFLEIVKCEIVIVENKGYRFYFQNFYSRKVMPSALF
jgi:hypothetical protein